MMPMYCTHTRHAVSCLSIVTHDNLLCTNYQVPGTTTTGFGSGGTRKTASYTYLLLSELNFLSGTAAYQNPTFGSLNNENENLFS